MIWRAVYRPYTFGVNLYQAPIRSQHQSRLSKPEAVSFEKEKKNKF